MTDAEPPVTQRRRWPVLWPWVTAAGVAVGVAVAWHGGREPSAASPQSLAEEPDAVTRAARMPQTITKLAARLDREPDDVQGRLLLARSYVQTGQLGQGIAAFREALALQPRNPGLLAELADALAFANGQRFNGESRQLLARALELDPSHAGALSLAGLAAFDAQDYAAAAGHWRRYLQAAPEGAQTAQVRQGLLEAEQRLQQARRPAE